MHVGMASVALAVVIAALLGIDRIEFAGVLAGWMTAAAAAAATAAWAGCAWLAALAVREERRGRLIVIAAGSAAAALLLAALHSAGSAVLRWTGWHPVWVSILMVLFILALVTIGTEVITRTEPASLVAARRRWHRAWDAYLAAVRVQRSDAEAAAVAAQEWCSLIDIYATVRAASGVHTGGAAASSPARPATGTSRRIPGRGRRRCNRHAARKRGLTSLPRHIPPPSQQSPGRATMPAPGARSTADPDPAGHGSGGTMAIVLITLAIFTAGAIAGGYLLIIIGIRNEERRRSMLYRWAPDPEQPGRAPGGAVAARRADRLRPRSSTPVRPEGLTVCRPGRPVVSGTRPACSRGSVQQRARQPGMVQRGALHPPRTA